MEDNLNSCRKELEQCREELLTNTAINASEVGYLTQQIVILNNRLQTELQINNNLDAINKNLVQQINTYRERERLFALIERER